MIIFLYFIDFLLSYIYLTVKIMYASDSDDNEKERKVTFDVMMYEIGA